MDDPAEAPRPEGGWSTRVRSVPGAVVNHVATGYLVHPSGVLTATGEPVPEAVLWRGRPLMVPPPMPDEPSEIKGRWLWGGPLHDHFGHFLIESIGRLWALDACEGPLDGIVFVPERGFASRSGDAPPLLPFQRQLLDLLGIRLPILVLDRPARFDCLEVPGQGFGIGALARGTGPYRDFIHRHFATDIAAAGPERLYLSRARLGGDVGGMIAERRLEKFLSREGFEIFHPQLHSMPEQIARYKAARQVVALDGSALHLFGMVGRAAQEVAVIRRRHGAGAASLLAQLESFAGRPPLVVDAILRNWVRSDRNHVDNYSYGELDFTKLSRALAGHGFIPPGTEWPGLTDSRVRKHVKRVEAALGDRRLTFRPALPKAKHRAT